MLTVEQCKSYLQGLPLSDKKIEELRDALYAITQGVLAPYFTDHDQ